MVKPNVSCDYYSLKCVLTFYSKLVSVVPHGSVLDLNVYYVYCL